MIKKDIDRIEAQLKEAFTNDAFTAYRKLTMVRWPGECVDVFTDKIRQLVGLMELSWKGINLACQWQSKVLHGKTDSVCMYHWVSDTLTGRALVHT